MSKNKLYSGNWCFYQIDRKIGTGVVERVFNRDKVGLMTSVDVNFNGSKRTEEYKYSADKRRLA